MNLIITLFSFTVFTVLAPFIVSPGNAADGSIPSPGAVPHPDIQYPIQLDSANSTPGYITFDEFPINTVIKTQYKKYGVLFNESFIELDNYPGITYLSGDNENYPDPYGNGKNAAPITATFESPTSFVEADAIFLDSGSSMKVRAYDQNGKLIGTSSGTGRVRVEAKGIRKAIFSFLCPSCSNQNDDIAGIDNLAFDSPMDVLLKERGAAYGYDNFTDKKVPSKSVGKGYKDTVLAEISPVEDFASCVFRSSDKSHITVTPSKAESAKQIVTVKGIDKGASIVQAKNSNNDTVIGKMNAYTYNNLKKTVSITLVHKKGTGAGDPGYDSTDIPDADIKTMLKKVYKQAVMNWEITRLTAKRVAFDLNKDGKLDVESWMSDEMRVIRDACKSPAYDYNIFIVSHPTDGSCGFMSFNQKYGFIHADTCGNARTVCHELGHGQNLKHTPDDIINIMYNYNSNTKWRLRKNQWDILNP